MPWSHYQQQDEAYKEEIEGVNMEEEASDGEEATVTSGPVVAILVGMAGSGKSTLFHRIHYAAAQKKKRCYFINLDPAVLEVPIEPNMDIRDTVDYKGVMKEYCLGPNGAIVTSLNLYATQFSDVMEILDKRANDFDYVVIDTPGQIEAFTWSASGQLIAESLASTFATCVVYVVDSPRSSSPATFMSNMVYACSLLHKLRLPLVAAFNKSDVASPEDTCFKWMDDFEEFHVALDNDTVESYVTSLHRSMSLVLDEFYKVLDRVAVSAATGQGIDDLWAKLDASKKIYDATYGKEIRRRRRNYRKAQDDSVQMNFARLQVDLPPEKTNDLPKHQREHQNDDEATMKKDVAAETEDDDEETVATSVERGVIEGEATEITTSTSTVTYTRSAPPKLRTVGKKTPPQDTDNKEK